MPGRLRYTIAARMRLFARGLTLLGAVAGIAVISQAFRFHRALGPLVGLPFAFTAAAVGIALLVISLVWFWRLGRDPYGERATEKRFRKRFNL